ncbi:hypothetical protein MJO28_002774, partial [Puccinia striiformis f. sp. tritici]
MFSENLQTLDKRKISTGSVGPGGPYGQGVVKNPTMVSILCDVIENKLNRSMYTPSGESRVSNVLANNPEGLLSSDHFRFMLIQTGQTKHFPSFRILPRWASRVKKGIKASYLLSIKGSSKQLRTVIANVNYVILLYAAQY